MLSMRVKRAEIINFAIYSFNPQMKNPKIVHLHIKEPPVDDYFSSLKAIYEHYDAAQLGLKYTSLLNAMYGKTYFENKKIVIRIGVLKSSTRKPQSHD